MLYQDNGCSEPSDIGEHLLGLSKFYRPIGAL